MKFKLKKIKLTKKAKLKLKKLGLIAAGLGLVGGAYALHSSCVAAANLEGQLEACNRIMPVINPILTCVAEDGKVFVTAATDPDVRITLDGERVR